MTPGIERLARMGMHVTEFGSGACGTGLKSSVASKRISQ